METKYTTGGCLFFSSHLIKMDMLHMVLPNEIINKVLPDARKIKTHNNITNKYEFINKMNEEVDYWKSEVTYNNPIQEAIVADSLWRVVNRIQATSGPYNG